MKLPRVAIPSLTNLIQYNQRYLQPLWLNCNIRPKKSATAAGRSPTDPAAGEAPGHVKGHGTDLARPVISASGHQCDSQVIAIAMAAVSAFPSPTHSPARS